MVTAPHRGDDHSILLAESEGELLVQRFSGDLASVAAARHATAESLADIARIRPPVIEQSPEDVLLVVNELTTNSVRFAPGPFILALRATGPEIHICVYDTNPKLPRPRQPDASGQGGWGWLMISTLASRTRIEPKPNGKSVHAFIWW